MHGKRKKDVSPLSEEERKKSEEQGEKVISMINEFLDIRHSVKQVQNPSEYCNLMASMCPDLPTIYNYKREVMIETLSKIPDPRDKYKQLANELMLITSFLKRSPKSYGIWAYRQWLVLECRSLERLAHKLREKAKQKIAQEQEAKQKDDNKVVEAQNQEEAIPQVVEMELKLCNKMLDLDERNFHCWNYRNWLISEVEKNSSVYVERELVYTQQKYEKNFSNFSALHFRAKNLERKYEASLLENNSEQLKELVQFKIPLQALKDEFELIKNAIFIQPNEQGVWLYHKWLLGLLTPFRLISAQSLNKESTLIQLAFSAKILSDHLIEGLTLLDQEGKIISDALIESKCGRGIDQIFIVNSKHSIQQVVLKQLKNPSQHIKESNTAQRYLISSTLTKTSENSNFLLSEIEEEDLKFEQIATSILQEELAFVEEIIEAEKNCKFPYIHKLFLLQVKQTISLVFHPYEHHQGITVVNEILETIEKVKPIAKKQLSVLASQTAQFSTLLSLLNSLNNKQPASSFFMPISPCYETGVLIPYYSLLIH